MNTYDDALKRNVNNTHIREYSTSTTIHRYKILGKNRHHIFTNKEWKDSSYNYDKAGLRELPSKYKLTNKLVRYHFNINDLRHTARSRRMRSLIIRSSSKRIFTAKPEIKQTSDKTIITIYAFDRQKQSLIRNLYFYNRNKYIRNYWYMNKNQRIFIRYRKRITLKKYKNKRRYRNRPIRGLKIRFPYQNLKLKNEMDFLRLRFSSLYKKFFSINNNFMFLYIYSLLSYFNIKIIFLKGNRKGNNKIKNIINNKPELLILVNDRYNKLNIIKKENINPKLFNLVNRNKRLNVSGITINKEKLNYFLFNFLHDKLNYTNVINQEQITLLNIRLKNNFYNKILTKYFKANSKILNFFTKLELNKLKYNDLLINLKRFISKVYDKTTELNVINLKYMYLNSDIYSELIANKLRKKRKFTKVLARSLKIVKLPYKFIFKAINNNFNDFQELGRHRDSKLTNAYYNIDKKSENNRDRLEFIFKNLFPHQQIHSKNNDQLKLIIPNNKLVKKTKIINILNTVRYKWVKGVTLELAGRLTRRNTASRSIFKYKSKGNLNNKQYYSESNFLYSLSPIMLRNSVKANSQYTQVRSKRRIGAFGINSWISSY